MKNENSVKISFMNHITVIALLIVLSLGIGLVQFFYDAEPMIIIGTILFAVLGSGSVLFLLEQEKLAGEDFVVKKRGQQLLILLSGLLCAIIFPLLPVMGWPYPIIAVMVSLYTTSLIGVVVNALLIALSVLLAGADASVFLLYFMCGTISILLFRKLDEEFKITIPVFLSGLVLFLFTAAEIILQSTDMITIEFFVIPFINVFITTIFYFIFLKYYSIRVVHKYRDKFMILADPEYELIVALRERSKESYYQVIHAAYFSDKIARNLGCDARLAKTGAYYHKRSFFCMHDTLEEYQLLMEEHQFPPQLCELLLEYNSRVFVSKENAIIYFSDTIVAAIRYLFHKDPQMKIDYDQVIGSIFEKKIANGILDHSELTMAELTRMEQMFKEENLYYDFLR